MRRLATLIVIAIFVFIGTPQSHNATIYNDVVETATTVAVEIPQETISQLVVQTADKAKSALQEAKEDLGEKVSEEMQQQISISTEQIQEVVEEVVQEQEEEEVINNKLIDNLSEWSLTHDNAEDVFSIWKKTDKEGNLVIVLKNEQEEIIVAYKYEGIQSNYEDWVLCVEEITSQDICDYAFTPYHEVGGSNPQNVQAQVCVLINRQNCEDEFADTVRGVITEEAQYACSWTVVNRWLKSDSHLEKEDLEKCFQQTILVLAGELIQIVPENVLFAARGAQGSGIWQVIDGTYYCYI